MKKERIEKLLGFLSDEEKDGLSRGGNSGGLTRRWAEKTLPNRSGCSRNEGREIYNYLRGNYSPLADTKVSGSLNSVGDQQIKEYAERGERVIDKIVPEVIRTLDDLIEACEIDIDTWEIAHWSCTTWTTTMKIVQTEDVDGSPKRTEKPHQEQNFRVTARLKYRAEAVAQRNVTEELLARIEGLAPTYKSPQRIKSSRSGDHLLLLTLPDTHIGKYVDPELGVSWGIDDALDLHAQAVEYLLSAASGFDFDRVLVMMGNDVIHVDNRAGTTTSGTMVDRVAPWEQQFLAAEDAYRHLIDRAQEVAPVDVMVVHGNHPSHSEFTLGRVINAWYNNAPHVRIDTTPRDRKYFRYGVNLIGGTHGKNEKPQQLPMLMAEECSRWWSETLYREFHTGHLHHRKKYRPNDFVEIEGVLIRQSSALCPADTWHVNQGFIAALRSAQAYVYSRNTGWAATFSFNVYNPEREFIGLDADAA